MNFVSGGLRKTAAEEKQHEQKGDGDSDDSDDDGPSAPPPPRGTAPKKLQMVNLAVPILCIHVSVFSISILSKVIFFLFRVISGGTSPRGLQVAYSRAKELVAGRSTQGELDRNSCRKWATNQAKAWARMHKVGRPEEAM